MILPDIDKCLKDYLRPKVEKGVAYLDEKYSGWVDKIVPDALKMPNPAYCICGQVFQSYYLRPDEVRNGSEYGFNLANDDDENLMLDFVTLRSWQILEQLWLEEIAWRTRPLKKDKC